MSIALVPQQSTVPQLTIVHGEANRYRRFFDFNAAYQAVLNHVEGLPSDRTPDQHTRKNYSAGLKVFLGFLNNRLPTETIMKSFIAYLKRPRTEGGRELKSTTVSAKYLTPARHFCRELAKQPLPFESTSDASELFGLPEWREKIRQAAEVKNPKADTTTNIAPLWNPKFKRLTLEQVNAVLRSIDRDSLSGARDYALLLTAFSSALRLDELRRITLNNIRSGDGAMLIVVRGKRSNIDPVGVGNDVIAAIEHYVAKHNSGLEEGDPRCIDEDTPLWQPYMHGKGNHCKVGYNNYCTDGNKGITKEAIRGIIGRRTERTLGKAFRLAAHDTRRTAAAIAYDMGMPINEIQALLRHKSAQQTLEYIGIKPDYAARTLSTYVKFG